MLSVGGLPGRRCHQRPRDGKPVGPARQGACTITTRGLALPSSSAQRQQVSSRPLELHVSCAPRPVKRHHIPVKYAFRARALLDTPSCTCERT
eukprot:13270469-Alexandrium_andersonii.AAC.1